jgi:hypothetical protein
MSESVLRLRAATKRSIFSCLIRQAAVGSVDESRVCLQRVIPFFGNSFKPIFVGKFRQTNSGVVLDGKFTLFMFSKIFLSIWFGGGILIPIIAMINTLLIYLYQPEKSASIDPTIFLIPLICAGFIVIGILFLRFCWWLSRHDIDYLSKVITDALTPTEPNEALPLGDKKSSLSSGIFR